MQVSEEEMVAGAQQLVDSARDSGMSIVLAVVKEGKTLAVSYSGTIIEILGMCETIKRNHTLNTVKGVHD